MTMRSLLSTLFLLALFVLQPVRADELYVMPKLFDGALIISRASELSPRQQLLLKSEFERQAVTLVAIEQIDASPTPSIKDDQADATRIGSLACLRTIAWQQTHTWNTTADQSSDSVRQQWSSLLQQMASGSCVWINADQLPTASSWLQEELRSALDRGAMVCIESHAAASSSQRLWSELSLLPFVRWSLAPDSKETANKESDTKESDTKEGDSALQELIAADAKQNRMSIDIPAGAWLRVGERELINLSEGDVKPCRLVWPATASYHEAVLEQLPSRRVSDLVAARRALMERSQPVFPANEPIDSKLTAGSLVIVGGGGASTEIWNRFIELAGGASQASIVVLPTASPDPNDDGAEVQILRRLGVEKLHVLTQTGRDDVSSDEFLDTLRSATGVWFGGGRQWRFVDAYWATPAWKELRQVVARGGVIGGSSAGATIQGDLLVRGSPLGNQIMVCDGYRHGLALLPGVAIDQHFRQRNRFDDLKSVLKRFPSVTGIGIDEGTALVVQAPDSCEVLGAGSVWLSYAGQTASDEDSKPGSRGFIERPSGSRFQFGK